MVAQDVSKADRLTTDEIVLIGNCVMMFGWSIEDHNPSIITSKVFHISFIIGRIGTTFMSAVGGRRERDRKDERARSLRST